MGIFLIIVIVSSVSLFVLIIFSSCKKVHFAESFGETGYAHEVWLDLVNCKMEIEKEESRLDNLDLAKPGDCYRYKNENKYFVCMRILSLTENGEIVIVRFYIVSDPDEELNIKYILKQEVLGKIYVNKIIESSIKISEESFNIKFRWFINSARLRSYPVEFGKI